MSIEKKQHAFTRLYQVAECRTQTELGDLLGISHLYLMPKKEMPFRQNGL